MKKIIMALITLTLVTATPLLAVETKVDENYSIFRLHMGLGVGDAALSITEIQKFIDAEITPRFIEGMTIYEGLGQWQAPEGLIKERTTVVDVQAPNTPENQAKVEAIAKTYVDKYQEARVSLYVTRIDNTQNILYYNR